MTINLKNFGMNFVIEQALPIGSTPLCVRSMSNKKPFKNVHNFVRDNELNVVIDKDLKLMWQDDKEPVELELNWKDAINYCENLELAGFDDWRLPNVTELATLFHLTGYENKDNIPYIFKNLKHLERVHYYIRLSDFWSSTTVEQDKNKAYVFPNAKVNKEKLHSIKCVRDVTE